MVWDLIGIIILYGLLYEIFFKNSNSSDEYNTDGSPKKDWYY